MIQPCPVAPLRPAFSFPCRFTSGAHGGQRPRPAGGQLSSPLGTQGAVPRAAGQGQHKAAFVRDLFTRRGHFCGAPVTEPRRPPSARRPRAPKWRPRPALPASPLLGDEPSPHPPPLPIPKTTLTAQARRGGTTPPSAPRARSGGEPPFGSPRTTFPSVPRGRRPIGAAQVGGCGGAGLASAAGRAAGRKRRGGSGAGDISSRAAPLPLPELGPRGWQR